MFSIFQEQQLKTKEHDSRVTLREKFGLTFLNFEIA
jgi:hypothetical protein